MKALAGPPAERCGGVPERTFCTNHYSISTEGEWPELSLKWWVELLNGRPGPAPFAARAGPGCSIVVTD